MTDSTFSGMSGNPFIDIFGIFPMEGMPEILNPALLRPPSYFGHPVLSPSTPISRMHNPSLPSAMLNKATYIAIVTIINVQIIWPKPLLHTERHFPRCETNVSPNIPKPQVIGDSTNGASSASDFLLPSLDIPEESTCNSCVCFRSAYKETGDKRATLRCTNYSKQMRVALPCYGNLRKKMKIVC
jgi:hypothetical protein